MSTNKHKEKISAFLDDELHADEVTSFCSISEAEDARIIQRYRLAGDALRRELSDASFINVSEAVHNALQGETLAARRDSQPSIAATASRPRRFSWSTWFRPAAGMAVAASVAMIMVVSLSDQNDTTRSPLATNIQQPAVKSVPTLRLASDDKAVDKKAKDLDPRLVNRHLEFATQDALQGRLPYVRSVSYQKKQ